jgi:SAM-dependent methyltransferase
MTTTYRLTSEQAFHDRQARQRALTFARQPEKLHFDDASYLDHESWIRPAFEQLGDVRGTAVLDFGCGHGMAAVVLARRGARVTAFDLSRGYLDEARQRARANGATVHFTQADGERLPFADQCFDRIWGSAILHHLDLDRAGLELRRVLRPGGVAVFCEPWGENPLLRWARRRLHYPGKERTVDEQPLRECHVHVLRCLFPRVEVQGFQLASMARRLFRSDRLAAGLDWGDQLFLRRFPALQRFCRYVVLIIHR